MPTLKASREIHADVETVYTQARRIDEWPKRMPNLQSVTTREWYPDGQRTLSEWLGVSPELNLTVTWVQEDIWDEEARTCRFRQLKGDFSVYNGEWRFIPIPSGTRFDARLHFELNLPLIGPLVQGIAKKLMQLNLERALEAIVNMAEAAARDRSAENELGEHGDPPGVGSREGSTQETRTVQRL